MDNHTECTQSRQISPSIDTCKCALCKKQLELQQNIKKSLPNIHVYHHLKKRQGPPIKKEANKESSFKPKIINKQFAATPGKKVDRSKEAYPALVAQQYHMVSHSQRLKEGQNRKDEKIRAKGKNTFAISKLTQIKENLENLRENNKHTLKRDKDIIDASPNLVKTQQNLQRVSFK